MEIEKIERFVNDILTISAIGSEGGEQPVGLLLYHLLTAVSLYEVMTAEEKQQVDAQTKKLQYFFRTRFVLKERKRNKEKKSFPPKPPYKRNSKQRKSRENSLSCLRRERGF